MKIQTKIDYFMKSKNVGVCSVAKNLQKLFVKSEKDQIKTKEENMLQPDLDTHITEQFPKVLSDPEKLDLKEDVEDTRSKEVEKQEQTLQEEKAQASKTKVIVIKNEQIRALSILDTVLASETSLLEIQL